MSIISQSVINQVNQIPLTEVMMSYGHIAVRRTAKEVFYRCPFHDERDASFKVDLAPSYKQKQGDIPLSGFYCYSCSDNNPQSKGYGALMLWAALEGVSLANGNNLQRAVNELAKLGNLIIDGDYKNGFFHRAKVYAEAMNEICFIKRDYFTDNELRALGCQVTQVFKRNFERVGEECSVEDEAGNPTFAYSWNPEYYKTGAKHACFDGKELIERFNLYPLDGFITEQREGRSYEVSATSTYPIFAFIYQDEKGWWAKKYEPYFKRVSDSDPSYKFTWWFQGGKRRDEELSKMMYGDSDVMRALAGDCIESRDAAHPTIQVKERKGNDTVTVTKFKRLILCSGPRDGINTYYHSDAHVCWPHSEGVKITPKTIVRLREIANEVIVMYDNDRTGIERANQLSLAFLELKTLYLPKDLATQNSPRTGKPCKDAEEYFSYYPMVLRQMKKTININEHFLALLQSAKEKKFWDAIPHKRKNEFGEEEYYYRYTLLIDRMCSFLAAKGLRRYKKDDVTKFVYVSDDNKVEIIPDKDIEIKAKELMKSYINESPYYYDEGLLNAISTGKGMNSKTLSEVPLIDLDFNAWTEDSDYFYFGNTSVLVTEEEVKMTPYAQMPYHVNRNAILDNVNFVPVDISRYFTISSNPQMKEAERQYKSEQYDLQKQLASITDNELRMRIDKQIKEHRAEYKAYEQLYKYKVEWHTPIEECPPLLQTIYDMSRIYWRKEEAGFVLTPRERQMQDAHFINKILGLGYMLSRFRTDTRQHMVMVTDYSVAQEGSPSGRNGKTMFAMLLDLVRCNLEAIPGKDFRSDQGGMAQNFQNFQQTVHSSILIDDLSTGIDAEAFYNYSSRISVRNLYENTVRLQPDVSPKIILTMNEPFNLNHASTYGRTWPIFVSDYYHEEDLSGQVDRRTPETKFGYHITKSCSIEEKMFNINLMLYCLQCYFRFIKTDKGVMRAPLGDEATSRLLYQEYKENQLFYEWAQEFFKNKWHFARPIALREMAMSYLEHVKKQPIGKADLTQKVINNIKRELLKYCTIAGIVVNPDVVYSSDTDRKAGSVRTQSWVTVMDSEGIPVEPRRREKNSVSCLYFYRRGDAPKLTNQVLPAPEEDEEAKNQEQEELTIK